MRRLATVLVSLMLLCGPAFAEPSVPLLPSQKPQPKKGKKQKEEKKKLTVQKTSVPVAKPPAKVVKTKEAPERHWDLGFEIGATARKNDSGPDILGMELLPGFRGFARIPVGSAYYLIPSAGFFMRNQGSGDVGFSTKIAELGLNSQYAFYRTSRVQILGGVVQRFNFIFSGVTVPGLQGNSNNPVALRYWVGPATGVVVGLTPLMSLVMNNEVTYAFTDGGKLGAGFTMGVLFHLD